MEETFENAEREQSSHGSGYAGGTVAIRNIYKCAKAAPGTRKSFECYTTRIRLVTRNYCSYTRQIDPTREDGMFLDGGEQYTAIYVNSDEQKKKLWSDRSDGKIERV